MRNCNKRQNYEPISRIAHLERRVEISKRPEFKLKAIGLHCDGCQRFFEYILETKSAVCEGPVRGPSIASCCTALDALTEAVRSIQQDVTVADKYEGG